jgi:hypothetical protein
MCVSVYVCVRVCVFKAVILELDTMCLRVCVCVCFIENCVCVCVCPYVCACACVGDCWGGCVLVREQTPGPMAQNI